ncbi:hypothetical protein C6341_g15372 [Phytophthora cactorum]|nr:hypothetical protein C6341_g15372 [Phytophthora cactorum]
MFMECDSKTAYLHRCTLGHGSQMPRFNWAAYIYPTSTQLDERSTWPWVLRKIAISYDHLSKDCMVNCHL